MIFRQSIPLVLALGLAIAGTVGRGAVSSPQDAPVINFNPGPEYGPAERKYQGIPTLERAPNGRLWAAWYAGSVQEDRYNYVVAVTSADDGKTWSDLKMVIDPDRLGPARASDPCLWLDPGGRLWLFWFQNSDKDTSAPVLFAIATENPDDEHPRWSVPRLIGEGIMINKPLVLTNGDWLLPAAIWRRDQSCRVLASTDRGLTWQLRGTAGIPRPEDRQCDEPMIVERRDGSLWMLVRTNYGIGETVSADGGRTWAPITPSGLPHTPTRFFLRRLASGQLLLLKHGPLTGKAVGRKQLRAFLSADDGRSWRGGLMIDERASSYPDATQSADGVIRVIYDHDRMDAKNILYAAFSEDDVLRASNGDATSPPAVKESARFKVLINAATGVNTRPWLRDGRFLHPKSNTDGTTLLNGPAAELAVVEGTGEIKQLIAPEIFLAPPLNTPTGLCVAIPGQRIFRDRQHTFNVVPEALASKRYVLADSNRANVICRSAGVVFVLATSRGRSSASAGERLLASGFTKAAVPEFLLTLADENKATAEQLTNVYQKSVSEGERIELHEFGVIVF